MRICCITHHQLVNNPRVFREAEALSAAGHDVRVISVYQTPRISREDAEIAKGRKWRFQPINIEKAGEGHALWLTTGLRKKAARLLWNILRRGRRLAGYAYTRTFSETIKASLSEPVDLIIAHTQPMLAPAFFAAKKARCRWAFDFEDLLSEEYGEGVDDPSHKALVQYVEKEFMPYASYITVASEPYVAWIKENIRPACPVNAVQNTASLTQAPVLHKPGYPSERKKLQLHWFSISLGPQRGLEDAVRALKLCRSGAELHLRGDIMLSYADAFHKLVKDEGVEDRVHVHARVPQDRVVLEASVYDVGLDLMQPCCLNHELATPNKLFFYMMAGLAIIATDTKGHRSILGNSRPMGFIYPPGDAAALAKHIDYLAEHPEELARFREAASAEAKARWNWESEQKKILACVKSLS